METSIKNRNDAYVSIIESLSKKEQLIFQLIKENAPCTSCEISEKYLIPINEITGRVTGLKKSFLIVEQGSKKNRWTNKNNTLYRAVKNIDERIDLINAHFVQLREQKDNLVNDYNTGLSTLTKDLIKKHLDKINKQINSLTKILDKIQLA
ncbi:hypothetical protein PL373_13445 [Tenacibaculum maritimum]|nr:hypothetical protein [Tenacibaculum maritimum]MDB0602134.1 hypothetical protein [Tenacibaculum maritimum]MDB0613809.1 hypothetical protein [Tenacibaculum maritimum]